MKIYLEKLHQKNAFASLTVLKSTTQAKLRKKKNEVFTIVYTGAFYDLKRDPSEFFAALEMLKFENFKFQFNIFTTDWRQILHLKNKFDLEQEVTVNPEVPVSEALNYQMDADLLLLIMWISKTGLNLAR